jgi:uncharacterized protein (DUF2062 family)
MLCLESFPGEDGDCEPALRLARLVWSGRGWSVDPTFLPPRLQRLAEKPIIVASALGIAVGLLVGLLLGKGRRQRR